MENNWSFPEPAAAARLHTKRRPVKDVFNSKPGANRGESGDLNWHLCSLTSKDVFVLVFFPPSAVKLGGILVIITNAAEQREKESLPERPSIERRGKNVAVKCRHIKSHAEMVPLPRINGHINWIASKVLWKEVYVRSTHTHTQHVHTVSTSCDL